MKTTYIRWSMTVIEMDDLTIVTDPVFRVLGFRLAPREYTLERLPKPDLILVSHRHVDHWDRWAMSQLPDKEIPLIVRPRPDKKIPFIMRSGDIAADARRLGYTDVRELPPWQKTEVKSLTITAVPAKHPGTEVGFVIQGEKTIYFAGDTALDHGILTRIGQRFDLDVVLLPIGGLRILGWRRPIDPGRAVEALKLLHPKVVVGIHWGGLPRWLLPGTPEKLVKEVTQARIDVEVRGMAPLEAVEV